MCTWIPANFCRNLPAEVYVEGLWPKPALCQHSVRTAHHHPHAGVTNVTLWRGFAGAALWKQLVLLSREQYRSNTTYVYFIKESFFFGVTPFHILFIALLESRLLCAFLQIASMYAPNFFRLRMPVK